MFVEETMDELWMAAMNRIKDYGHQVSSRDGHTTEILGFVGRLTNPRANFMFNPRRMMNPAYAAAEMIWYLSGTDDITMIQEYAPQYKRFAEDGKAFGAYGHRWYTENQLLNIVLLLLKKPDTRQAVMTMHKGTDLRAAIDGSHKDIPCTLSLNFIIRDSKLNLVATMRSNDIWLGLPYDAWSFCCLQQIVAEAVKVELGWYQHQAMSLHIYDRNEKAANEALKAGFNTDELKYNRTRCMLDEAIETIVKLEQQMRTKTRIMTKADILGPGSLFYDLLVMASTKWRRTRRPANKIMEKYMEDFGC